jgi:hypothetical protein
MFGLWVLRQLPHECNDINRKLNKAGFQRVGSEVRLHALPIAPVMPTSEGSENLEQKAIARNCSLSPFSPFSMGYEYWKEIFKENLVTIRRRSFDVSLFPRFI